MGDGPDGAENAPSGSCYAHVLFTKESIERCRLEYPDAPVVAHPECIQSVRDIADEVCSTEKMVSYAEVIARILSSFLQNPDDAPSTRELPDKQFVAGPQEIVPVTIAVI